MAASGITAEKPLYGVLMTVRQAAGAAQEAVKGGARGITPEGERALLEGAAFVAQLAGLNDAAAMRAYCQAHTVAQGDGIACTLPPVWLKRGK